MPAKLTHEEYIDLLKEINPNIIALEQYNGRKTKILHHCNIHNVDFYTSPELTIGGHKVCPQCISESKAQRMLKSHEQYVEELKIKFPHIIPIDNYIDSATKIKHKCLIHNYQWDIAPNHMLKSVGCPKCRSEKERLRLTKTHETYLKELKERHIDYIPLEKYITKGTNILHKCNICGHEWKVKPDNILRGSGCPKCSNSIGKTNEEYVALVKQNNPNIELLESYKGPHSHIKCRCIKHNYVWNADADNILRGGGCCFCGRENSSIKRMKTNDLFMIQLKEVNKDIIPLEEYHGTHTKIKFKCLKCNYEWSAIPQDILHGVGCPQCNISKGENQIAKWLSLHNIEYIPQKKFNDCIDIHSLPFDFYLPNNNKCIEFDGKQHFEPLKHFGGQESFEYRQRHDKIKTEYCKNNNIPLLRIPYYANVEEELENFLLN